MTNEELLKPRYKVIADYPYNGRKVGDVFCPSETVEAHTRHLEKYPNIFKKLEWWEDRDEKDMPEYVKWNGHLTYLKDYVTKVTSVKKFDDGIIGIKTDTVYEGRGIANHCDIKYFLPASEEEYKNQIK